MEITAYTAHKNNIMQNVKESLLNELKSVFDAVAYKYVNNTQLFENDGEYAHFCRTQLEARALEQIAFRMKLR